LAAALAAAVLLCVAGAPPVLAQQDAPPPVPVEAPAADAAAPAAASDPVANRIGRLEEQIHDLQVMVGALTSLVKSKPEAALPQEGAGAAAGQAVSGAGGLGARVDALETQMGALTSQIELMTQRLGAIEARLGDSGTPQSLSPPEEEAPPPEPPGRQGGLAPMAPSDGQFVDAGGARPLAPMGAGREAMAAQAAAPSRETDAGTQAPLPPAAQDAGRQPASDQPQSLSALPPGTDSVAVYDQGYGDLLRKDYAAAEISFRQLVKHFPNDPLAGKAQYWLGESYFVRGQFKEAADAFLNGYKKYKSGEKAPDCLVKLGMSLAELGQKDAACSTLSEFATRFPSADPHLQDQAKSEQRKARC
jgi:tol-pal system protein YbgF